MDLLPRMKTGTGQSSISLRNVDILNQLGLE